jgi:hypothetical protein
MPTAFPTGISFVPICALSADDFTGQAAVRRHIHSTAAKNRLFFPCFPIHPPPELADAPIVRIQKYGPSSLHSTPESIVRPSRIFLFYLIAIFSSKKKNNSFFFCLFLV